MYSKNPASIIDSPNASVAIECSLLKSFRSHAIFRAKMTPMNVAPSQTPNAFTATMPILSHGTPVDSPPAAAASVAAMIPLPIARTIRPRTSSITAPAMMVTPSSESIFLRSDSIRAVMPTEVAVDIMPMYIGAACITACPNGIDASDPNLSGKKCGSRYTAQRSPKRKLNTTPPIPTIDPTNEYLMNIFRFVSRPERKRSMMDARVAMP